MSHIYPFCLCVLLIGFLSSASDLPQNEFDTLIKRARIIDGTGNPWFYGDVGIKEDRITAIGHLQGATATTLIDAEGRYLAPGFIDSHSHTAGGLAGEDPAYADPLLAQGLTSVIINPDGSGPTNMIAQQELLRLHGLKINVLQLVPHGTVRRQVMGMQNRQPNATELDSMRAIVQAGMKAGAWGLSSGPFYTPGSYSDTQELIELASVAGNHNGVYTSHIRDESNYTIGVVQAVEEVIHISREANLPGIITHIKVLGPPVWGYSNVLVERINRARDAGLEIYADQYPYTASATGLAAALVPRWAFTGDSLRIRLENNESRQRIESEMVDNLKRRGGADRIQFRYYTPDSTVEGRTLQDVSDDWAVSPIDAAIQMILKADVGIVSFNMTESDVETLMAQPWTMTSSDGSYVRWGHGVPHPRIFGAFPRKIRKYVIEERVMDLPAAIRSMTSLPAQVFEIPDRGIIKENAFADLVLFDLDTYTDKATFTEPYQVAEGVSHVWVNGLLSWQSDTTLETTSGRVLLKN